MKKILVVAALLLCACGVTRYPVLDTTQWASAQDSMFAAEVAPDPARLKPYEDLADLQTRFTPTNLTLRQKLLWAAADPRARQVHAAEAARQFDALQHNGFWSEGFSYFEYVRGPLAWYARVTGDTAVGAAVTDAIWRNYAALVDPTGSLPLPEVSEGLGLPPSLEKLVGAQNYFVRRWFSGDTLTAYILVAHSGRAAPAFNLHHRLEAGYFALWIRGAWVVRCKPYTGWGKSDPMREGGFYDLLPRGAVLPNVWRTEPPAVYGGGQVSTDGDGGFSFTWISPAGRVARREIRLSADSVIVTDSWGARRRKTTAWRL